MILLKFIFKNLSQFVFTFCVLLLIIASIVSCICLATLYYGHTSSSGFDAAVALVALACFLFYVACLIFKELVKVIKKDYLKFEAENQHKRIIKTMERRK